MAAVAARMWADFEASTNARHAGAKGSTRETMLRREFLDRYLSSSVGVLGSSEIVDSVGSVSGQCDIVLVDPRTPPLWDGEDHRIVPAECVYAVIEVKSHLSTSELRSAFDSIRRVKALTRTAYRPQLAGLERTQEIRGERREVTPVFGHIFAYQGAKIETLGEALAQLVSEEPNRNLWPDSVFVLDQGLIAWEHAPTHSIHLLPSVDDVLCASAADRKEVLMWMLGLLNMEVSSVIPRKFDPRPYLEEGSTVQSKGTWSVAWT